MKNERYREMGNSEWISSLCSELTSACVHIFCFRKSVVLQDNNQASKQDLAMNKIYLEMNDPL